MSEKVLDAIAEKASEAGDIRVGFTIPLTAGYLAERDGKSRIKVEEVQTAAKTAKLTTKTNINMIINRNFNLLFL